ncbi:hypothetical protein GCWU000182_01200 [Abiotrophia defectiva ATCC 49176]|uniref:Uncharacterized protein n=1 Tax=Abiotrophia defectiva ATCC 49176 TaxID=592010 RepID=W1Q5Z9_ABIDE|nr:hypothetical protein GCWU000182_01200 [Abiotrophia defectiva ATCC 49176]
MPFRQNHTSYILAQIHKKTYTNLIEFHIQNEISSSLPLLIRFLSSQK